MPELKSTPWRSIRMPGMILLVMAVFCSSASAGCSACTFVDSWIEETINSIFSGTFLSDKDADLAGQEESDSAPIHTESDSARHMLLSPQNITGEEIILDVSDYPAAYIPGAVHISYRDFLENNTSSLKNVSDIARILGDAGISRSDPLLVYGECQPCGGGPSAATYVYWLLRYLGHEDVWLLNGGIDAWTEAGLAVANSSASKEMSTYSPQPRMDLYASYDYVMSGQAQIVDARSGEEFEYGSIPGAINIPYEEVLDGKKIREADQLKELFRNLTVDKPVVVFTTTGTKASVTWFSLTMLGYDARMYTYRDWSKEDRLRRAGEGG